MAQMIRRYACDRCHGQKLRCIHQGDGCARCAKAKALCTWTEVTAPKVPANLERDPETLKRKHIDEPLDLVGAVAQPGEQRTDWLWSTSLDRPLGDADYFDDQTMSSLGTNQNLGLPDQCRTSGSVFEFDFNVPHLETALGDAFALPNLLLSDTQEVSKYPIDTPSSQLPQSWTPPNSSHSASTESPDATSYQCLDRTDVRAASSPNRIGALVSKNKTANSASSALSTIQELSNLNVKLYEHASVIPKPPQATTEPLSWKGKDFAMDKTFELSQSMIELLNRIYPRYGETPLHKTLKRKMSNVESSESRKEGSSAISQRSQTLPCIDQGSMLLVLSCYLRLIDTYDNIFGNMQACLDRSSVTPPEDYVSLPCVKVGSFTFPPTSAMQITMVLHFASELLGRLREITQTLQSSSNTGPQTPESQDRDATGASTTDITTMTLDAVTERQNELVKRIKVLRQSLIALDVI